MTRRHGRLGGLGCRRAGSEARWRRSCQSGPFPGQGRDRDRQGQRERNEAADFHGHQEFVEFGDREKLGQPWSLGSCAFGPVVRRGPGVCRCSTKWHRRQDGIAVGLDSRFASAYASNGQILGNLQRDRSSCLLLSLIRQRIQHPEILPHMCNLQSPRAAFPAFFTQEKGPVCWGFMSSHFFLCVSILHG
jgi:hypothetical protein